MILKTKDVSYWYKGSESSLFNGVNLSFEKGKMYSILGTSGSGKTTFLSLIAGLDEPKEGTIYYKEEDIQKIGLRNYRKQNMSIIFQSYNLLPYLSAVDNVVTAMEIAKTNHERKKEEAYKELEKIGIGKELADSKIGRLSGGQQQRVAIVRALCCDHDVIVADEPTGNLDSETSMEIVKMFKKIAHEENKCIIMVTHEQEVAKESDAVYELKQKQFTLLSNK